MKTIDDLISDNDFLQQELLKIPEKTLNQLRSLTNIYILSCLENDTKHMDRQRGIVDRYMMKLSKEYDVKTGYFKQMLNLVETYYCSKTNRARYAGKD